MDAADRRGVKPVDPEFVDTLGDFDALGLSSRPEFDRFLVLLLAGGVHMLNISSGGIRGGRGNIVIVKGKKIDSFVYIWIFQYCS